MKNEEISKKQKETVKQHWQKSALICELIMKNNIFHQNLEPARGLKKSDCRLNNSSKPFETNLATQQQSLNVFETFILKAMKTENLHL